MADSGPEPEPVAARAEPEGFTEERCIDQAPVNQAALVHNFKAARRRQLQRPGNMPNKVVH